ncbi:HGL092Wp [Eremothecium sinecaudum]|uniref:Casein kinase II subunit beta n=1 Tax=Eremothecium sinecaudum TaxID=45286 RepID=A0A109V0E9_9SACH|nr:HGL092Wp [Eremothecium sinecaudum]AMD22248.1 HGL092Wp [Eremothecium sinecaudum]
MSFMEEVSDVSESSNYDEWIPAFCSRFGHEFFCQVPTEFIEDDFNLTGLSPNFPLYRPALDLIMGYEPASYEEDEILEVDVTGNGVSSNDGDLNRSNGNGVVKRSPGGESRERQSVDKSMVEHSAEQLYGLIHARYILTKQGLQAMAEKFDHKEFGTCPRYYCGGMQLLPCGLSDTVGKNTVRLYCASCQDLYLPHSSRHLCLEGAFWGTSFPGVFLKHFKELEDYVEQKNKNLYRLRIFGFPVAKESVSGPRMEWLRQYPSTEEEWDEFRRCEFEIPPI